MRYRSQTAENTNTSEILPSTFAGSSLIDVRPMPSVPSIDIPGVLWLWVDDRRFHDVTSPRHAPSNALRLREQPRAFDYHRAIGSTGFPPRRNRCTIPPTRVASRSPPEKRRGRFVVPSGRAASRVPAGLRSPLRVPLASRGPVAVRSRHSRVPVAVAPGFPPTRRRVFFLVGSVGDSH